MTNAGIIEKGSRAESRSLADILRERPGHDFSDSFGKLRPLVVDSRGTRLIDFVKTLTPRYGAVHRDIALGYFFLVATMVAAIAAEANGLWRAPVIVLGAVSVGYWIAYLQLFIHEGAHWNLAADREKSDRICNGFIAWLAGLDVKRYRRVHFQHHRALGMIDDSENSYFFPLNVVFLLKGLFGIRVVEVLLARDEIAQGKGTEGESDAPSLGVHPSLVAAAVFHASVCVVLLLLGYWASALAWACGVGMVFPLLGALRQLLEHRADDARSDVDYRQVGHGAVARIFGGGLFAGTFGGGGFNRHLLHHWEPVVSYTRLADLERFLLDTPLREVMQSRTTTYGRVFRKLLLGAGRRESAA
jgi:fatty acid desaturase